MSSTYEDPAVYRHGGEYVVTEDIEDIYKRWDDMAGPQEEREQIEEFAMRLLKAKPTTEKELTQAQSAVRKQLKITPRRSQLLHMLPRIGTAEAEAVEDKPALENLRKLLVKKAALLVMETRMRAPEWRTASRATNVFHFSPLLETRASITTSMPRACAAFRKYEAAVMKSTE